MACREDCRSRTRNDAPVSGQHGKPAFDHSPVRMEGSRGPKRRLDPFAVLLKRPAASRSPCTGRRFYTMCSSPKPSMPVSVVSLRKTQYGPRWVLDDVID